MASRAKWLWCLLMLPVTMAWAQHELRDLDINVVLDDNGDAHITEVRKMNISSKGTECYIVIGNLNRGRVKDLSVTDETGREYVTESGEWDVDRSREQKRNRCGIHHTGSGYELCWGLGDAGDRTYTTRYTVTYLVQGYKEADGFNYMFVAEDLNPRPQHARITIQKSDTTRFEYGRTRIWAFRYKGTIDFKDGKIVAETTEPFSSSNAMIVMASFEKGMFNPEINHDSRFEKVKEKAFKGSSYKKTGGVVRFFKWIGDNFEIFFMALVGLFGAVWAAIVTPFKVRNRRRKLLGDEKQLLWYRGIPAGGNLKRANGILNRLQYKSDYDNLISAYILKLFYLGYIRFDQIQDRRGNLVKCFRVVEFDPNNPQVGVGQMNDVLEDYKNLNKLYQIFLRAAGEDHILEPRELEKYMKENAENLQPWAKTLHSDVSFDRIQQEEARQLFGLKKFLQEFTLSGERQIQEVHLWKDYLVYATLFGIAKQVMDELAQLYPEYKNLDRVFAEFEDNRDYYLLYNSLVTSSHTGFHSAYSWTDPSERGISGGGGWSSIGGGGGFSGGGSGGGVR